MKKRVNNKYPYVYTEHINWDIIYNNILKLDRSKLGPIDISRIEKVTNNSCARFQGYITIYQLIAYCNLAQCKLSDVIDVNEIIVPKKVIKTRKEFLREQEESNITAEDNKTKGHKSRET